MVGGAEDQWTTTNRCSLIGFVGSGKAFGDSALDRRGDPSDNPWRTPKGIGSRSNLATRFDDHIRPISAAGTQQTVSRPGN